MELSSGDFIGSTAKAVNLALQLPNFRMGVANVRAGTGDCKIAFVGDSTTTGAGSSLQTTIPSLKSYPSCLGKLLNSFKVTTADGLGVPPSTFTVNADQRWNAGSGWSLGNFGAGSGACWQSGSSSNNLVYTESRVAWDRATIYYLTSGGLGTFTGTATGGTPVVQSTSTGGGGVGNVTISASSASTANTVTINSAGQTVFIVGIEVWRSSVSSVRIGNMGVGNSTSALWVNAPTTFGAIPLIESYAPNLTLISLGINDAINGVSLSTFISNLTQLITAAKTVGDVMIVSCPPSSGSLFTLEAAYAPALLMLTNSLNIPYVDIFDRFGGAWNTNYMSDNFYPKDVGYQDWATAIFDYIGQVI